MLAGSNLSTVNAAMRKSPARDGLPHVEEFRAWLTTLGLAGRSLSDIVLPARRASGMVDLRAPLTDAEAS